jgi:hypothetical protein
MFENNELGDKKMKLSRSILLAMTAALVMLLTTAGFVNASGILKQEYWVSNGFACHNHAGSTWHAQTFVANSTYKVVGVELAYINQGSTGNATVSIRNTDANGEPTGADLITSNPVNLDSLPAWPPTTVYFDFNSPYLELTSGVKYALVARVPDASGIFCIGYYNPGGFPSGEMFQSFNSGSGWMLVDNVDTNDMLFRIYGEQGADPSIAIEKATNGFDADTAPGPSIPIGDPVTWTYVVTNTGNVPLTNVTVTDDQEGVASCPQDTLQVGESMTCTIIRKATAGQYSNNGTAEGTDPSGLVVDDEDSSHYYGGDAPPEPPVEVGGNIYPTNNSLLILSVIGSVLLVILATILIARRRVQDGR